MEAMEGLYNWASIPNESYVIKYVVQNSGYNILMSDMTYIYGEELKNTDVRARFCELNPFAEMKSDVLLQHINSSLVQIWSDEENVYHQIKLETDILVLTLNISTGLLNFAYEIRMNTLPANQMLHFIIGPTIFGAFLSQHKVKELEKNSTENVGSSNIAPSSSLPPVWFGEKVQADDIIKPFVELQTHFNDLLNENKKLHHSLKEENITGNSDSKLKMIKSEKKNVYASSVEYEDFGAMSMKIEQDIQESIPDESRISAPKRAKRKKEIKF